MGGPHHDDLPAGRVAWRGTNRAANPRRLVGARRMDTAPCAEDWRGRARGGGRWWLGGTLLLFILAVWSNGWLPLKLYPVLVNVALLGVFAYSLISPPSIIERFARMREPDLPVEAIGYTRRVTQVWCGFFSVNGAIALMTALWASATIWTLYNGLIAYLVMGLLFGGEYFTRWHFKKRLNV